MADNELTTIPTVAPATSVVARWQELAATIPTADDQDALEQIAAQVFDASTPQELAAPWALAARDFGSLLNLPVRIQTLRKSKSDYDSGPGFFLVLDLVQIDTGEKLVVTTGAVSVMAQLIKAHAAGWLPLSCVLRQSDRPSGAGYYPQHLEILSAAS